jgi:hypothetical protein
VQSVHAALILFLNSLSLRLFSALLLAISADEPSGHRP